MLKITKGMIVFDKVTPVKQFGEVQYYTTLISVKELAEIYEQLTYDGDAQRGLVDGKPFINKKHVLDIYNSFLNGESIRGHLTWNMRDDDSNIMFDFNTKSNELIISNEQLITIPDSAHRHQALKMIYDKHRDDESLVNSKFTLDIYNLTKTEEKELFYTINGKTKVPNRNRVLYLSNDLKNKLIRSVIENSKLNNHIDFINSKTPSHKLTKFSTLYESIFGSNGSFKNTVITKDNYNDYVNWFSVFYNELLGVRSEFKCFLNNKEKDAKKFKDESKNVSMLFEELTWWGYAYLAKELMNVDQWKNKLRSIMNKKEQVVGGKSIDFFSKETPIWHATVIRPKYNYITKTHETGVRVYNNNTTRSQLVRVFQVSFS